MRKHLDAVRRLATYWAMRGRTLCHIPAISNRGWCSICEAPTRFVSHNPWLRDNYRCKRCHSIPRERALFSVLAERAPGWRSLTIHESSPGLPSSDKLARECACYLATHYFPGIPSGTMYKGFRCESLERLTFSDESFDLVVTQDVMEHVLDPEAAFREIGRTLRPGGMHVFTTPIYDLVASRVRARYGAVEQIEYLAEPQYHGNPIDSKGALVTIDYGRDIVDLIFHASGLSSTIYQTVDAKRGLLGEFLEVIVSVKPG